MRSIREQVVSVALCKRAIAGVPACLPAGVLGDQF